MTEEISELKLRIRKLTPDMVMHVTYIETRELKIRIAISKWLIRMATKVLGCGLEVKESITK